MREVMTAATKNKKKIVIKDLFKDLDTTLLTILKILSIILLACFASQLYTKFAIDKVQVLPDGESIIITLLRWFTCAAVGLGFLTPWMPHKYTKIIFSIFRK